MMALPSPIGVTPNLDALRNFVNIKDEADWRLLICFVLFSLRPKGPFVILIVNGSAGSAKSTFCRTIRSLIDPSSVPTQALPEKQGDLIIAARNSHLPVFDNVRKLSTEMSDSLCRIATGGGNRTRALFTDSQEILTHFKKPMILNGISDIADQTDLINRSISLQLPPITSANRMTEAKFDQNFEIAKPQIFSGLVNALKETLSFESTIKREINARMADFFLFGLAVEKAMDWPAGSFEDAYEKNQKEAMESATSEDPVVTVILKLFRDEEAEEEYKYTPKKMLALLESNATKEQKKGKNWPSNEIALGKRIVKIAPVLQAFDIECDTDKRSTGRYISFRKTK